MKAVLRLPADKAPQSLIQEGRQKAKKQCLELSDSSSSPEARFATLCDCYNKNARIYEALVENFHISQDDLDVSKYFARGIHTNDDMAIRLMATTYKSSGALDEIMDHMRVQVKQCRPLRSDCTPYERTNRKYHDGLQQAFTVFSTKGLALPETLQKSTREKFFDLMRTALPSLSARLG